MFNTKYIGAFVLAAALFTSCKKDKHYDVTGDADVKFFTNATNTGDAPVNSVSYNVVNIPTAGTSLANLSHTFPATIKLPVFASKPISSDVTIGAELDNSLIAKYNEARGTNYSPFPAGILNTANLTARILKDNTSSTDSLTIVTDPALLNTLTERTYMAPIKLTTVSDKATGAITSSDAQVVYVIANIEQRRIKYLATTADVQGSLLSRTPWTVTFNQQPGASTNGSIVDGSTTTYSRWSASPVVVDINMQDAKNVTGIRLYTSNSATYTPTQVQVSVSNDGITYDLVGSPLKANLTFASSYNYILFYKAIAAKYVRLSLTYSTSTNTQNFRITELDVYAN